jgi:8-oxo-dGTP pyrophosphatase MutT (NUDIX family)
MAKKNRQPDQAGVVAYRRAKKKGLLLCLAHKPHNGAWAILKGIIDPGETPRETALKEAWEEAGVHGKIVGEKVGTYSYRKWGRNFDVAMYLMKVTDQDDEWDEMHYRDRCWLTPDETLEALDDHPARKVFAKAIDILETEAD